MITFNVLRSQKLSLELGSAQEALICQVIAWHHFLSAINETAKNDSTFDSALKLWENYKYKDTKKKLSVSLVSHLTNIPFETTRRKVKKLEKKSWIIYSKKNGITLNPKSELNKKIVSIIHPYEKELLTDFLVSFLTSGKSIVF